MYLKSQQNQSSGSQEIVVPAPTATEAPSAQKAKFNLVTKKDGAGRHWIAKAKVVIQATHGDPYTQQQEISKLKSEYLKDQYNRDIKILNE